MFLREPVAAVAFGVLALIVLAALLAPWLGLPDPTRGSLVDRLKPPLTPGYPLGTDEFGRDLLSRVVWGARVSLGVGFLAVAIAAAAGVALGLVSGYLGGRFDFWAQRFIDLLLAFPYILLALMVVAILGPGLLNTMLAIAIAGIPYYVRIARASALALREREFVEAAEAAGASTGWILVKHVLSNSLSPILVAATLDVGFMIMAAAGMSFLGLGAQPPLAEWGVMLSNGRQYLRVAPWVSLVPGAMIFLVVLALNLLGDRVRDLLDPRMVGR
ncbi:MAG: ABC transporter permease [Deinococcales bacterium]|nr:ABC transporter permease [Deinococcales bacterium]